MVHFVGAIPATIVAELCRCNPPPTPSISQNSSKQGGGVLTANWSVVVGVISGFQNNFRDQLFALIHTQTILKRILILPETPCRFISIP